MRKTFRSHTSLYTCHSSSSPDRFFVKLIDICRFHCCGGIVPTLGLWCSRIKHNYMPPGHIIVDRVPYKILGLGPFKLISSGLSLSILNPFYIPSSIRQERRDPQDIVLVPLLLSRLSALFVYHSHSYTFLSICFFRKGKDK